MLPRAEEVNLGDRPRRITLNRAGGAGHAITCKVNQIARRRTAGSDTCMSPWFLFRLRWGVRCLRSRLKSRVTSPPGQWTKFESGTIDVKCTSRPKSLHWEYDIHGDAHLRLKPTGQAFRTRLEKIDVTRDRACIGKQCATMIGQHRKAAAAIEELHTDLPFQVRERLANDGLRALEVSASTGPAANRSSRTKK
jgi:hypothetical protein